MRLSGYILSLVAVVAATMLASASFSPALAQSTPRIAFVDLEYALNNVEEGKKAKAILNQDFERKSAELDQTRATLQRLEDDLESQSLVLSDEARRQKEAELLAARARFDADRKSARESWQKKEANLTRDLLERLTVIVQEIGREGKYSFILERHDASVLYAEENVDLTRQVVERFNKKGGR